MGPSQDHAAGSGMASKHGQKKEKHAVSSEESPQVKEVRHKIDKLRQGIAAEAEIIVHEKMPQKVRNDQGPS